jgi:hypothetical protein
LSEVLKRIIVMTVKPLYGKRLDKAKKYVHKYAQTVLVNEKTNTP